MVDLGRAVSRNDTLDPDPDQYQDWVISMPNPDWDFFLFSIFLGSGFFIFNIFHALKIASYCKKNPDQ